MSHSPQIRQLGGLETLVVPGDPGAPVLVLLHGYGADAWDLAPLAQALPLPQRPTWLVPNAPLEVPIGPHMTGRAWFPIDMVALELAMISGRGADLSGSRPPALESSRQQVAAMLREFGADPARVVIGGFSQGAMVATDWTLHSPVAPCGLVILSGTLIDRDGWARLAASKPQFPYFQSHGRHDPLLPVAGARALHTLLQQASWQGELMEFNGQHEIPMAVLSALQPWLVARLDGLDQI